ncbi:transcription factor RFX4-like [Strongylocentrotus purpuratus]|uniref:DNA-binding protein RFX6 n=1 Tax=Strongylocentrotus purpuratus TaxID=7668 RepID=A0A7M7T2W7_STRPU|nr:transcription factor RFX4-like [Strongylocentrotus purpuratus]
MENKTSKRQATPRTIKWLHENYMLSEGVCIPRSALYVHYLDFCCRSVIVPINAASFGKVIRQQFPQITTRRLGTRGQSKYHYYGIAVRESSMYYESTLSKKEKSGPVQEPIKKETNRNTMVYSHRTKLGCLLPEFPEAEGLSFPLDVSKDLVATFLVMYRTHCQRILDTVIRANFDEVQHYLLHFWHGMPAHVQPILGSDRVARLIGICDSLLYKAVSTVLMPGLLQPLPESLGHVIRWFSKELQTWLKRALHGLPTCLQVAKLEVLDNTRDYCVAEPVAWSSKLTVRSQTVWLFGGA